MQASKDAWIMTTVSILCAMFTSRENDHHLCFFPAHAHHNFSWPLGDGERVTVARIYFSSLISVNKLHHSNEIWTPTTDSPCLLAWLCFLFCRQQKMTGCKFQHQKRATGFRWQPCLLTGSFEKQGSLGHLRTGRGWWVWKWKKKQRKGWLEFCGACSAMAPLPLHLPSPPELISLSFPVVVAGSDCKKYNKKHTHSRSCLLSKCLSILYHKPSEAGSLWCQ